MNVILFELVVYQMDTVCYNYPSTGRCEMPDEERGVTTIRIDGWMADRADRLVERLKGLPEYRGVSLSRSAVLRRVIDRGLDEVEDELAARRPLAACG
jgi:hypothetical protein